MRYQHVVLLKENKREMHLVNGKHARIQPSHVVMVLTQELTEAQYQNMTNAKTQTTLMRYQNVVVIMKEEKRRGKIKREMQLVNGKHARIRQERHVVMVLTQELKEERF